MLFRSNEVAVEAFLQRRIRFPDIARMIGQVLDREPVVSVDSLDAVFAADQRARVLAGEWLKHQGR